MLICVTHEIAHTIEGVVGPGSDCMLHDASPLLPWLALPFEANFHYNESYEMDRSHSALAASQARDEAPDLLAENSPPGGSFHVLREGGR